MSSAAELTLEYLHECFEPDYENGLLHWKERPRHHFRTEQGWKYFTSQFANKPVSALKNGYYYARVRVLGCPQRKCLLLHRVLYQMYYDKTLNLDTQIDHIDGNSMNNSIINLRECSNTQNQWNSKKKKTNTTGVKGVILVKDRPRKYRATVKHVGKAYCKYFYTLEEAEVWVKQKRKELHGEFANDGE